MVTVYAVPGGGSPDQIAAGPDGALWFTLFTGNSIGRITKDGAIATYNVPAVSSEPKCGA